MNAIIKTAGLIVAILASACTARADVLVGNLAAYTNDGGGITQMPSAMGGKEIGFTTGLNTCTLTDSVLRLNVGGATNLPVVYLYSGGSTGSTTTAPTTLVATFINPAFT